MLRRRMHRILEVLWQHGGLAVNSFQSGRSGVLAAFSISHTQPCKHPSCTLLIALAPTVVPAASFQKQIDCAPRVVAASR
jgi:hypothetical protein